MKPAKLPPYVLEKIARGEAILFLGAGCSRGCKHSRESSECPDGPGLGRILSAAFLGGRRASEPLARIADFAVSEAGLTAVQIKVAEVFEHIEPLEHHLVIPKFRWRAIVTTNYDRVIEKAYERSPDRLQDPVPVIRDGDLSRVTFNSRAVPIIKLHGCISQAGDAKLPMVLANEQYVRFASGRARLARTFQDMARDSPIIFCGYQFNDLHIQAVLFGLDDDSIDRPQYVAINPAFEDLDSRLWARHRLTALTNTFEEFARSIDKSIPTRNRVLGHLLDHAHGSMSTWFKAGVTPSRGLESLLSGPLEHVHAGIVTDNPNPERFFRGDSRSWAPIKGDLDFARSVTSQLLASTSTANVSSGPKFVLLKGHAGAGKTVLLRRVAWDNAAEPLGLLTFYMQESSRGLSDHISELCELTGERVTVIVDNALVDPDALADAIRLVRSKNLPVTIVAGARFNEWFVESPDFGLVPDEEFSLGDLSLKESTALCAALEKHNCLGELAAIDPEERPARFMDVHDRQLLVALHEVTSGKPLRDIILSEYRNILPPAAQVLYLDICTLHRLGVLVRAGLISRVSGIRFDSFKDKFLGPLDKVVSVMSDWQSRDFVYKARHRDIAQIVFEEVLRSDEDRANQIARIVAGLNTDYTSDDRAASALVKGKLLADEFAERKLADRIFDAASQSGISPVFIAQQRAVFELNHPGGSDTEAMRHIDAAINGSDHPSSSLYHTKALVFKALARNERLGAALQDRHLESALELLRRHGGLRHNYTAGSTCEVLFLQFLRRIEFLGVGSRQTLEDEAALQKLSELERSLSEASQRFPEDPFLTSLKARLHSTFSEHPKAIAILTRTNDKNPANESVALRLARELWVSNNSTKAVEVLRKAVKLNPGSKVLSFELALKLIQSAEWQHLAEIGPLLRRSFSDGDSHFEAQFWFARHEFLHGDKQKAAKIYGQFVRRAHPYVDTTTKRAIALGPDGAPKLLSGTILSLKGDFAFVSCPAVSSTVYLNRNEVKRDDWVTFHVGDVVSFKLGFSFRGPACVDARKGA